MRRFVLLLVILMLVFSLNTFAKDAFSFEANETNYEGMDPFFTGYRDSRPEDFSIVENEKWWHGTRAMRLTMTHAGARWILLTKNYYLNVGNPEHLDSTFLQDLDNRDTIYYYVYIPWNAPIDSIFIFVRNQDWAHDGHTVYHPSDLRYGRWNALKDGISDDFELSDDIQLIQSDFQIDLVAGVTPACTLYFDAISSKGKVPGKYCDTTGQAGIEIPEQGDGVVKVSKGSINCIEYAINATAPVLIQVFNIAGQKMLEIPIGIQGPGSYSIPLDLAAGVYITRVVVGEEEETGKAICAK